MFVKDMKFPLLLDVYGSLLTERKRELLDYYYNEDYSLAEIAELTGLTRQGVRDGIKKGEEALYALEEKLGAAVDGMERTRLLDEIARVLEDLNERRPDGALDAALQKLAALRAKEKE